MKRRVVHIITGLPTGGSQMMLFKLLSMIDRQLWDPEVISLRDVGVMGERIASLGIRPSDLVEVTQGPTSE